MTVCLKQARTIIFYEAPHRLRQTASQEMFWASTGSCAGTRVKFMRNFGGQNWDAIAHYNEREPQGEYTW